ncbi:MAG TPA: acyltransferase [Steroidobacteraceae bacterium]|nr:acyltransferase [Steroidobacteraceae bacterium]
MKRLEGHDIALGGRSQGIDVLRGLAVLLVVLHHIHLRFQLNKYPVTDLVPEPLGRVLFWSGYYSVIAFFVISGFLITTLSVRRWSSLPHIDLRHFYWLRIARIVPCLVLLLCVSSVLHWQEFTGFVINPNRATLGRALVAALTFHVNWLEGRHGYLPGTWDVLWSLSVEEVFYIFFPLICVAVRSERWLLPLLACMIAIGPLNRSLLVGNDPWESYAYLSCMDAMAFGCLAAWISARIKPSKSILRYALGGGIACILLIVVFRKTTFAIGLTANGLYITVLACGVALVLLALANDVGNATLSKGTAWLQSIGHRSYEIYLTHMFVVLSGVNLFKRTAQPNEWIPIAHVVLLLLCLALGYAVARWYSEPANRWLRTRFVKRPQPAQVHPTAA